jgi:hypothetical protein
VKPNLNPGWLKEAAVSFILFYNITYIISCVRYQCFGYENEKFSLETFRRYLGLGILQGGLRRKYLACFWGKKFRVKITVSIFISQKPGCWIRLTSYYFFLIICMISEEHYAEGDENTRCSAHKEVNLWAINSVVDP